MRYYFYFLLGLWAQLSLAQTDAYQSSLRARDAVISRTNRKIEEVTKNYQKNYTDWLMKGKKGSPPKAAQEFSKIYQKDASEKQSIEKSIREEYEKKTKAKFQEMKIDPSLFTKKPDPAPPSGPVIKSAMSADELMQVMKDRGLALGGSPSESKAYVAPAAVPKLPEVVVDPGVVPSEIEFRGPSK